MTHKNGFTLLEVLFVLVILGIVIFLSVPLNMSILEKQQEKQFLNTFESDVLYMQAISRTTNHNTRLVYNEKENSYSILSNYKNETLTTRSVPKQWEFDMWNTDEITFNSHGTISKPGTLKLKTKYTDYRLIFSLGKGRYRVERK